MKNKTFNLGSNWQGTADAFAILSSKEIRYALAVATSQTGKAIAENFSSQFESREVSRLARVTTMAKPQQSQIHAVVEVPRARVFTPSSRHRLPKGMRRTAYLALMNQSLGSPPDPNQLLDAGAFIIATRAGGSFNAPSSSRTGKTLALIAQRRGLTRLPIDRLARIYPFPKKDLSDIAKAIAMGVFSLTLSLALNRAYARSHLPMVGQRDPLLLTGGGFRQSSFFAAPVSIPSLATF